MNSHKIVVEVASQETHYVLGAEDITAAVMMALEDGRISGRILSAAPSGDVEVVEETEITGIRFRSLGPLVDDEEDEEPVTERYPHADFPATLHEAV